MNCLTIYQRDLERVARPLAKGEAAALFERMKGGDRSARQRIIESMLRLAYRIADQFASAQVPLTELLDEANLAVILAVDRWNPAKGAPSTIVAAHVRNALIAYLWQACHRGIYIPLKTLRRLRSGAMDDPSLRRRVELRMAAVASEVRRFSELRPEDGSPLEIRGRVQDCDHEDLAA